MAKKISAQDRTTLLRVASHLPSGDPKRRAILSGLQKVGREFGSDEALEAYLREHPKADPKNHWVTKSEKKPAKPPEEEGGGEGAATKEEPAEGGKSPKKAPVTKPPKGKLFTEEETSLPSTNKQPISDPDKLFEQAAEAHQQQLSWLNQGKGLDKALGAKVVRGDKGDHEVDYSKPGPIILIGPTKKKERSAEKVNGDFGGDWSQLGDIVRASVAVDSMDEIEDVMDKLRESGLKLARKPKDRFANPTEAGYRDLMMNVEYPNGHIGELQLHLKPVLEAKGAAHKLYEKTRSISAAAQKEGRDTLTEEEQAQVDEANNAMKKLYSDAYEKATGGKEKGKKAGGKTAAKVRYYDFKDLPAKWEIRKFPVVFRNGKPQVEYDLQEFFTEATPVDEKEFEEMVEDQEPKGGSKKKASALDWTDFLK